MHTKVDSRLLAEARPERRRDPDFWELFTIGTHSQATHTATDRLRTQRRKRDAAARRRCSRV